MCVCVCRTLSLSLHFCCLFKNVHIHCEFIIFSFSFFGNVCFRLCKWIFYSFICRHSIWADWLAGWLLSWLAYSFLTHALKHVLYVNSEHTKTIFLCLSLLHSRVKWGVFVIQNSLTHTHTNSFNPMFETLHLGYAHLYVCWIIVKENKMVEKLTLSLSHHSSFFLLNICLCWQFVR